MALPRYDLSVDLQQIFAYCLFAIVVYLSQQSLVAKQSCNEVKQKISWEENPFGTPVRISLSLSYLFSYSASFIPPSKNSIAI